jgi:hypothetical protein
MATGGAKEPLSSTSCAREGVSCQGSRKNEGSGGCRPVEPLSCCPPQHASHDTTGNISSVQQKPNTAMWSAKGACRLQLLPKQHKHETCRLASPTCSCCCDDSVICFIVAVKSGQPTPKMRPSGSHKNNHHTNVRQGTTKTHTT